MTYTIYSKMLAYLEELKQEYGDKTPKGFTFVTVHKHDCKCEQCLRWWVCLGPIDRDGDWDFGPFTRQEFEAGGGVVPFDTTAALYAHYEGWALR